MLEKFRSNKNMSHIYAYNLTFLGYGTLLTSLGALIPYLTSITGILQTEYSFLFFYRCMGSIAGCVLLGRWKEYHEYHSIIAISSVFVCIFSCMFTFSIYHTSYQAVFFFLASYFQMTIGLSINICILLISSSHQIEFWMLLTHGIFGIGGLIGPIMVYLFQENTLIYQSLLIAIVTPFYLKLQSPDRKKKENDSQKCLVGVVMNEEEGQKKDVRYVSYLVENLICLILFLYVGLQIAYGGWISSYAVLSETFTKQQATRLPTIYWIAITIFRITSAFINRKSSEKLQFLINSTIVVTLVSILFIKMLGFIHFTCYFSAVSIGICFSAIFPLMLSLPMQFGFDLQSNQTSKIIMCASLSEGMLSMGIGYLMEWFNIDFLFYSLAFLSLIMWANFQQIIQNFKKDEVQPIEMTKL